MAIYIYIYFYPPKPSNDGDGGHQTKFVRTEGRLLILLPELVSFKCSIYHLGPQNMLPFVKIVSICLNSIQ